MKSISVAIVLCALSIAAFPVTAAGTKNAIVDRIDADKVIKALPLKNQEWLKSGNGRTKQLWTISGAGAGSLEIIGNDQHDADLIGWQCTSYDKAGNGVYPSAPESFCHTLFVRVLGNFVKTPDWFAKQLLDDAAKTKRHESRTVDDFSLETDGSFYFVRRASRIAK